MLALLAVLAFAVIRPRGLPEVLAALPAAVLVLATGAIPLTDAIEEVSRLGPVVGFLAAVLVLGRMCEDEGLFHAAGAVMARIAGQRPRRLLVAVFAVAAAITAVLSLDATVVLLTPVVFATAARLGVPAKPHVYACAHLANSGSLPLPVSNLTNLLALAATGISFVHFAALMSLPWIAAVVMEFAVFNLFFSADLSLPARQPAPAPAVAVPRFALAVLGLTLAGFVATSLIGINPAWAAFLGASLLALRSLGRRHTTPLDVVRAADPGFLLFVLALSVVVRAVVDKGLGGWLAHLVPTTAAFPALLAVAAVAAAAANLINNLPAVLVLLPAATVGGTPTVLAVLIGVNIGPNLTYIGSLATLLWRRIMQRHNNSPDLSEFSRLGLLTVPVTLVVAVAGLWAALQVIGV